MRQPDDDHMWQIQTTGDGYIRCRCTFDEGGVPGPWTDWITASETNVSLSLIVAAKWSSEQGDPPSVPKVEDAINELIASTYNDGGAHGPYGFLSSFCVLAALFLWLVI